MALWTAASGMLAQNLGATRAAPGTRAPVRKQTPAQRQGAAQKARSARFLTGRGINVDRRGIGAGSRGMGATQPEMGAVRRAYPDSAAEMLVEARAQHRALVVRALTPHSGAQANPANTSFIAPWQPVGPAQVTTATYGALTGRVSSIAVDPSDPSGNTVYVGTTGGGVWRSANAAGDPAAAAFAPLTDTLSAYAGASVASLSIGAMSVQPGGTGVVLAGTGDPNDATDSYYGAGLLRSADSGATWSLIQTSSDLLSGARSNFAFAGNGFAG